MKADIHIHSSKMIPFPVNILYNLQHRNTLLPPFHLKDMKKIGLNFAIINGIGDPLLNRIYSVRKNTTELSPIVLSYDSSIVSNN